MNYIPRRRKIVHLPTDLVIDIAPEEISVPPPCSHRQLKAAVAKVGMYANRAQLRELLSMLAEASLEFDTRRAAETGISISELHRQLDQFCAALRRVRSLFPRPEDFVFFMAAHLGDSAAATRRHGHPGYPPLSWPDGLGGPYVVDFQSGEYLLHLQARIEEVIRWLSRKDKVLTQPSENGRKTELSSAVWLIGEELPKLYEQISGRRFGISNSANGHQGPGVRFVLEMLSLMGVSKRDGKPFSPSSIKTYWRRAKNWSAARQGDNASE